jgi:hypothetical protein
MSSLVRFQRKIKDPDVAAFFRALDFTAAASCVVVLG